MATYIPAYRGYITDVPEVWFKRTDGRVFHFDKISSASATPQVNYTEVNGGWGLYPVAYLPAQSTMEVTFTSVEFNAELFAMANNTDFIVETSKNPVTIIKNIGTDGEISFTDADCDINSIKVGTLETKGGTAAAQKQAVVEKSDAGVVTIHFHETDVDANTDVEIYYEQNVEMKVAKFDNKTSAFGAVILKYPVYAGGDEDSLGKDNAGGGIKGFAIMEIYRARATTMPGFDSNYKSTVENSVTFSTMDPSKAQGKNGKVYDIRYFDLANSTGVK